MSIPGVVCGLSPKVQDKCYRRLERLAEMGHELRRPEADFLRDGIYDSASVFKGFTTGFCTFFTEISLLLFRMEF